MIESDSDNNPYQAPLTADAAPFAFRILLQWTAARSMEGLVCLTLATAILLGWAAFFQIQRFVVISWLLLSLGIMTAAVSVIGRNWSALVFGLSATCLCLFCDFVIYHVTAGRTLLMQRAHHADELLRPIVLLYICVTIPVGVAARLRHVKKTATPDRHADRCSE